MDQPLFPCPVCGKSFRQNVSLKSHLGKTKCGESVESSELVELPFKCDECPSAFIQAWQLKDHISVHSEERHFKCEECGKYFKKSSTLRIHSRLHTSEIQCEICHKSFTTKIRLQDHMITHTNERPHVCHVCGQAFNYRTTMRCHVRDVHPQPGDEVKCDDCGKMCPNRHKLRQHLRKHSEAKIHGCDKCDKSFETRSCLLSHLRDIHNDVSALYTKRNFECSKCKKTFKRFTDLQYHKKSGHENSKPFECPECHAKFATKPNLKKHSACHSGITPFTCETCNCKFSKKSSLEFHLRNQHT